MHGDLVCSSNGAARSWVWVLRSAARPLSVLSVNGGAAKGRGLELLLQAFWFHFVVLAAWYLWF